MITLHWSQVLLWLGATLFVLVILGLIGVTVVRSICTQRLERRQARPTDDSAVESVVIDRVGELYVAQIRPRSGENWDTPRPMAVDDLIRALLERGCHQTDIGDAFYAADPEWLLRDRPAAEAE